MSKHNCWTCKYNITVEVDNGIPHPCVPWCMPYQDDVSGAADNGVVAWLNFVGFDLNNMPPRRTVACPCYVRGTNKGFCREQNKYVE